MPDPVKVLGVDFSGAKDGNTTWVARGVLRGRHLEITSCYRPSKPSKPSGNREKVHDELERLLKCLPCSAVAALDFPFSLPRDFAKKLNRQAVQMPRLWETIAGMEYGEFKALGNQFARWRGELMRRGDVLFSGPFSPLKRVNPDMLPMTFYGMEMLARLWDSDRAFRAPPLEAGERDGPTLLETMPGVLLRRFGLPAEDYKTPNNRNERRPEVKRRGILRDLPRRFRGMSGLELVLQHNERQQCIDNTGGDCLDSLVAALCAAMWAQDSSGFRHPGEDQREESRLAQLEGWLYAPRCRL